MNASWQKVWGLCALWAGCATAQAAPVAPMSGPVAPVASEDSAAQVAVAVDDGPHLGAGLERSELLVGGPADTHLGLWVEVPEMAGSDRPRRPAGVALVIDASGSMHGEKIRRAREAAHHFVERLGDGDTVALFAFDDEVMELMPPVVLGPESRDQVMAAIAHVRDDGNTNMYGAVQSGQRAVLGSEAEIRRVVLLSDGQANVGPSTPEAFAQLALEGAEAHTQVSALGIGLDYDERTLGALAQNSEGRLYHLEHVEQLAGILDEEVSLLGRTVATAAYLEIEPAEGVVIGGVENGRLQRVGSRVRLPLGSLYAGQERELLVNVTVPASELGSRELVQVWLRYVDAEGQARSKRVTLDYGVTGDAALAARSGHERVHAMLASERAAEAQLVAVRMLNDGDSDGASRVLGQAAEELQVAARSSKGRSKAKLEKRANKVQTVQRRAARSDSPSAARGAALEAYDDALEAKGF